MGSHLDTSLDKLWGKVQLATELLQRKAVIHAEWIPPEKSGRFRARVTHSNGVFEQTYELDLGHIFFSSKEEPDQTPDIKASENFHLCPSGIKCLIASQLLVSVTKDVKKMRQAAIKKMERDPGKIQGLLRGLARTPEERKTNVFFLMNVFYKEQMLWSLVKRLKDKALQESLEFYGYGVIDKTKPGEHPAQKTSVRILGAKKKRRGASSRRFPSQSA